MRGADDHHRGVRVLVAVDDGTLRENLPLLLGAAGEFELAFTDRGEGVACLARGLKSEIVILDPYAQGKNGLNRLRAVREQLPKAVIVVLTIRSYREYREACLAQGADFFLDKIGEFEKLAEILRFLKRRES